MYLDTWNVVAGSTSDTEGLGGLGISLGDASDIMQLVSRRQNEIKKKPRPSQEYIIEKFSKPMGIKPKRNRVISMDEEIQVGLGNVSDERFDVSMDDFDFDTEPHNAVEIEYSNNNINSSSVVISECQKPNNIVASENYDEFHDDVDNAECNNMLLKQDEATEEKLSEESYELYNSLFNSNANSNANSNEVGALQMNNTNNDDYDILDELCDEDDYDDYLEDEEDYTDPLDDLDWDDEEDDYEDSIDEAVIKVDTPKVVTDMHVNSKDTQIINNIVEKPIETNQMVHDPLDELDFEDEEDAEYSDPLDDLDWDDTDEDEDDEYIEESYHDPLDDLDFEDEEDEDDIGDQVKEAKTLNIQTDNQPSKGIINNNIEIKHNQHQDIQEKIIDNIQADDISNKEKELQERLAKARIKQEQARLRQLEEEVLAAEAEANRLEAENKARATKVSSSAKKEQNKVINTNNQKNDNLDKLINNQSKRQSKVIKEKEKFSGDSVKRKPSKIDMYSAMKDNELYLEVRKFLKGREIQRKPVNIKELNEEFGTENIRKLLTKSYLISTGKGVTVGR